jgi:hypothetical protein
VVLIAEPVSNTVLISATPQYFGEIKRIIDRIDSQPPQVMIQVLIAEVQLNNNEEVGVEFAIQSPVLFGRGGLTPGFNFNTTAPLPNSGIVGESVVGYQGLGNLGVGRASPTQGFGGFVFSASSDTFALLIRALQAQGRIDILSRPQVQVADNQTGFVQVGQNFPYLGPSTLTATGVAQQSIEYQPIGVTMRVTPRVNPDGKVLMRVEPQVASVSSTPVSLGNGLQTPAFNIQTVQTTVLASDGETIVLGGLISKQETRQENGIPYLKDIPYAGALFRYRTHQIQRREVLIIMTPHIVRSEFDHARIFAEESAKMKLCLPEIAHMHTHGMEVMGPASKGARPVPTNPGPIPTPQGYVPGPAYFGGADQPTAITPQYPPGFAPPGAVTPGFGPGGPVGALPPSGMPMTPAQPIAVQPVPMQPGAVQPGAVPPAAGVPLTLPPAGPTSAAPPQSWPAPPTGVVPVSAAQPTFTHPPFAQPVAPVYPQPVQPQPTFTMVPPGAPASPAVPPAAHSATNPVLPLPGMPVGPTTAGRGFMMVAPAQGKAAPPEDQAPTTKPKAREGTLWNTGNNIFR